MLADDVHGQIPDLERDVFWDTKKPQIGHTRASNKVTSLSHPPPLLPSAQPRLPLLQVKDIVPEGHLTNFRLTDDEMALIDPNDIIVPSYPLLPTLLLRPRRKAV